MKFYWLQFGIGLVCISANASNLNADIVTSVSQDAFDVAATDTKLSNTTPTLAFGVGGVFDLATKVVYHNETTGTPLLWVNDRIVLGSKVVQSGSEASINSLVSVSYLGLARNLVTAAANSESSAVKSTFQFSVRNENGVNGLFRWNDCLLTSSQRLRGVTGSPNATRLIFSELVQTPDPEDRYYHWQILNVSSNERIALPDTVQISTESVRIKKWIWAGNDKLFGVGIASQVIAPPSDADPIEIIGESRLVRFDCDSGLTAQVELPNELTDQGLILVDATSNGYVLVATSIFATGNTLASNSVWYLLNVH